MEGLHFLTVLPLRLTLLNEVDQIEVHSSNTGSPRDPQRQQESFEERENNGEPRIPLHCFGRNSALS